MVLFSIHWRVFVFKKNDIFLRDFGDNPSNLTSSCNAECHCSSMSYEPVCGTDGLIYFTPCHAGCMNDYKWMDSPMGKFKVPFCYVMSNTEKKA